MHLALAYCNNTYQHKQMEIKVLIFKSDCKRYLIVNAVRLFLLLIQEYVLDNTHNIRKVLHLAMNQRNAGNIKKNEKFVQYNKCGRMPGYFTLKLNSFLNDSFYGHFTDCFEGRQNDFNSFNNVKLIKLELNV